MNTQSGTQAKKHRKKHHKHNKTKPVNADQFSQTAKVNSNNLTLIAPAKLETAQKPK
jgi:hypothetical protein